MLAHLARDVREHLVLAVLKLNPKHRVRQRLEDLAMTSIASSFAIQTMGTKLPLLANFAY